MNRTQIYLSTRQLKLLKRKAFEEDISISEAIRQLIDQEFTQGGVVNLFESKNAGEWLLSLSEEAKKLKIKGPRDLASKLDQYLYGEK